MRLTDLVDVRELQRLFESFTALSGIATAIVDLNGEVLVATGWKDICTRFHRVHPATAARCRQSDTVLAGRMEQGTTFHMYHCANGLVDVAVPIVVDGQRLANLFTGQFLLGPADRDRFSRQAEEFGFDRAAYLEALGRVPILEEGRVKSAVAFLSDMAQLIGQAGLATRRLEEQTSSLLKANASLQSEITRRQEVEAALQHHRDQLEDTVQKRTRELWAAQESLIRKERLATLGQLIGTVSHEIRNPLGTIRTSAFAIADRVRDRGLGAERALERMERAIDRCDRIIEELLTFTRVVEPHLERTTVDAWLATVLEEQAQPPGATISASLSSGAELPIDRERIRRCLVNLLNNAAQALSEAGTAEGRIEVETRREDGLLAIHVRDNGPGIPSEHLPRLFEPLFSTRSFGVGLGLPIVKQIVESHGGGVRVDSEPGCGTCVTLTLPLEPPERGAS